MAFFIASVMRANIILPQSYVEICKNLRKLVDLYVINYMSGYLEIPERDVLYVWRDYTQSIIKQQRQRTEAVGLNLFRWWIIDDQLTTVNHEQTVIPTFYIGLYSQTYWSGQNNGILKQILSLVLGILQFANVPEKKLKSILLSTKFRPVLV